MPRTKDILTPAPYGLCRRGHKIERMDRRTTPYRAWKQFKKGIETDLGGLSFAQSVICETSFWKFFAMSEFTRVIMNRGEKSILPLMTKPHLNKMFVSISNSLRLDLVCLYGENGLKKAEGRLETLESYVARNYPPEDTPDTQPQADDPQPQDTPGPDPQDREDPGGSAEEREETGG